jgi:large subunit ribosomal protein L25
LHVDFMRVGGNTQVTVTVPVVFANPELSPGIRRGGILNIVRHGIELNCPVDKIPDQLVVELDGLEIGDSIHISRVIIPEGCRPTIGERDFTIASIAASSAVREEAAAAAAAPPAPEEPAPAA